MGQNYLTARIDNSLESCLLNLDGRNEPISTTVKSLDEPGALRGIAQSETELVHGFVEIAIEINESICRPEFLPNLFPGHEFARTVHQ
jgi:hypothetical protein